MQALSHLSNYAGIFGVIIITLAYALLQLEKISAKSFFYSAINILGSFLIIFSLIYHWNLSAFLMEVVWLVISFYGLFHFFWRARKSQK